MVDFVFEYIDALLVSGFEFFKLALPLIILYFLITKLRDMWDEGYFFEFLFMAVVQGGGMAVAGYHLYDGGSVWVSILISLVALFIAFNLSAKLWPPEKNKNNDEK